VNGNLTRQTDARGQRICFYYDNLNRLTGKHYRADDSCPATAPAANGDASYSYDQGANGKGQRTAMRTVAGATGAQTDWLYDARGHMIKATYTNIPGLPSGQQRVFEWSYDSADRVQTLKYPAIGTAPVETLTYNYDVGWRPISACSSIAGQACYVTSASYSALDQPKQWNFGNSAIQSWGYDATMQRLNQLQVRISGTPGMMLNRTYSYGNVGNVASITEGTQQAFDYDHRDRLVHMGPSHMAGLGMLASVDEAAPATNGLMGMPSPALPAASAPDAAVAALNDLRRGDQSPDRTLALGELPSGPHPAAAVAPLSRRHGRGVGGEGLPAANTTNATTAAAPTRPDFSRLPLAFIPNRGLTDAQARFLVRGSAGTVFFTPDEVVLALPDALKAISTTIRLHACATWARTPTRP
jgi:YD repeat-containing protein